MQQVFDQAGRAYTLQDKIGGGAQGEVFPVESMPDLVVKVFFPKFLADDEGENLKGKLTFLSGKKLHTKLPEVAWPEFLVFDGNRQWTGFAMQRVTGASLADNPLLLKRLRQQGSGIDRLVLARTALAFLKTLRSLHAEDVWVGDFNLGNFLFDARQSRIFFIDADSYQVAAPGSQFICRMTTPGMTAPEYLNVRMAFQWRSPESELFSGAIVAFLILMTGKHPFDARGMDNHQESLAQDGFAYRPLGEKPTGCIPVGDWEKVWNDFPFSLQQAFYDIFKQGYKEPLRRGSLDRLLAAVADYRTRLIRGEGIVALDLKTMPNTYRAVTAAASPAPKQAAARVPQPSAATLRSVSAPLPPATGSARQSPRRPGTTASRAPASVGAGSGGTGTASAAGSGTSAPDSGEPEENLAEISLWHRSKPQSFWGKVLWWLVG